MNNEGLRKLNYKLWLFGCWLKEFALPNAWQFSASAQKKMLLAVVALLVAVPVNYYMFSADKQMVAFAALGDGNNGGEVGRPSVLTEIIPAMPRDNDDHTHQHEDAPSILEASPVSGNRSKETAVDHAKKHMDTTYVCPMHPEVTSKDPNATCGICGMDLVPVEMNGEAGVVQLSSTVISSLGVRVNQVKRRTIYRKIDSLGYITYDENKIRTVSLRTEGWVERLTVKSVGDRVKQGDLLFEVYAPKLVNAQEEYVQAMDLDNGDGLIIRASKERLRALGVSEAQIEKLAEERSVQQLIRIYAPQDGVVTDLNIREGQFVPKSKPVISMADLSTVWLVADIFESQVDWVKQGQRAEAKLPFMPDRVWEGEVDFIYPTLDPKTRSLKVRLRFDNADEALKPNMYADLRIFARPKRKVLTVPREAVIRTGSQARVITSLGEGRFKPSVVHIGIETDDKVEIISGLDEGQEVVVSSQFLIDSESSMRAALMRMASGG